MDVLAGLSFVVWVSWAILFIVWLFCRIPVWRAAFRPAGNKFLEAVLKLISDAAAGLFGAGFKNSVIVKRVPGIRVEGASYGGKLEWLGWILAGGLEKRAGMAYNKA